MTYAQGNFQFICLLSPFPPPLCYFRPGISFLGRVSERNKVLQNSGGICLFVCMYVRMDEQFQHLVWMDGQMDGHTDRFILCFTGLCLLLGRCPALSQFKSQTTQARHAALTACGLLLILWPLISTFKLQISHFMPKISHLKPKISYLRPQVFPHKPKSAPSSPSQAFQASNQPFKASMMLSQAPNT